MGQMVSDLKVIAKHKKKSNNKSRMGPSTSNQPKNNVSNENLNVFKVLPEHFETIYNTNVDQQAPQFENSAACVRISNPFNSQSISGMQVILEEPSENTDDDEPGPSGICATPVSKNFEYIEDSEEDTTDSDDDEAVPYSYSDAEISALRRYAEKKGKTEMKPILAKKEQDKRSLLQRKVSFMPSCAIAAARKTKNSWVSKFNCARMKMSKIMTPRRDEFAIDEINMFTEGVRCRSNKEWEFMKEFIGVEHKPTDSSHLPILQEDDFDEEDNNNPFPPVIDLEKFNPDDYPIDDCDEQARKERASEIAEGVNTPPITRKADDVQPESAVTLQSLCQKTLPKKMYDQVDFIYRLVPNLFQITSCSYYWGKMDRYEAERLLDGKPEGTFLLRDSAQDDYLFSVSFRKYCRSLHARIEQWNHQFSFDSHDPGVFASPTVCGLIEHYKDPSCCMFFEPMLTIPLHRTRTFSLQHLARATICETITYDSIDLLNLPKSMKAYLHEYHYKQKIRVRSTNNEELDAENVSDSSQM